MSALLDGKKALVTGGAGRIGAAVVRAFLEEGAAVLAVDRSEEGLQRLRQNLGEECSKRFHPRALELEPGPALEGLGDLIRAELGYLDILVNCPGYIHRADFLEQPLEEYDRLFHYNTRLVYFICQKAAALMAARGRGKIINFASVGGVQPEREHSAYCGAKAALIACSRVMALELAPRGIQVNVVAPGPTETVPFTSPYYCQHPEALAAIEKATPAGRIGLPEDHAGLVVFLAGSRSDWITGQVVLSDGGLSLRGR